MRLLFLTYSVAGQSNHLRAESLGRVLAGEGHHVHLLSAPRCRGRAAQDEEEAIGEGVLRRLTVGSRSPERIRNSGLSLLEVARRRAAVFGENFDLVHGFGHRPTVGWVAPAAALRLGVPYVADWCDLFGDGGIAAERPVAARLTLGVFDHWTERRLYRRADAVTVISSGLEARARQLAADRPIARVLPGGLQPASADRGATARQHLGIPGDAPVVVHVSQNHQDVGLLTGTLARLAARRFDVHFLLVGPPIQRMDRELGQYRERLHRSGPVPHHRIPSLLAAADLALLPYPPSTKNECRFPCSFSEYVGAGLPVITQPTGDLPRLNSGRPGALLVEPDSDAMAAAADRVLQTPGLAAELRRQALETAARELCWAAGVQRLSDVYGQLVGARARTPELVTA